MQSTIIQLSFTGYLSWCPTYNIVHTFPNETLQIQVLIVHHSTDEFPLRLAPSDLIDIVDQAKDQFDTRLVMPVMLIYCNLNSKSWLHFIQTPPLHGYIYMTLSCVSIWEVCLEFIQCRFVSQECVCNYWLYRMARQTSQWHCPWYCPASLRNSKLCQQWMVSSVYTETSFECCDMRLRELEYSV